MVDSAAGIDQVVRSLNGRLVLSPENVRLVEDLATLVSAAAIGPELRAVLADMAERTRATIAAALPSPETRQRMAAWFEDPQNQAALQQLLLVLQTTAQTAAAATNDDEHEHAGEDRL